MPEKIVTLSGPEMVRVLPDASLPSFVLPVICERIRFYRRQMHMDQQELGFKLGISPNAISNWERGRSRPDPDLLPRICECLEITLYDLFAVRPPDSGYNASERELISRFRRLSKEGRMILGTMATSLLDSQPVAGHAPVTGLKLYRRISAPGIDDPADNFDTEGQVFLYAGDRVKCADCAYRIQDNSMEPVYFEDDILLVERISDVNMLIPGDYCVFVRDHAAFVRQYQSHRLKALNSQFDDITPDRHVWLFGRIIGVVGEEDMASEKEAAAYLRQQDMKNGNLNGH